MERSVKLLAALIMVITLTISLSASTLDFTSQIYSARTMALGAANIATPGQSDAVTLNPAGLLGFGSKKLVASTYGQEFDGMYYFGTLNLAGSYSEDLAFGLAVPFQTTDALPLIGENEDGTPQPLGYFCDSKMAVEFSAAKKIMPELAAGATVKWANHQIYNSSANNFGLDFSLLYQPAAPIFNGQIFLGAAGKNIFSTNKNWSSGRSEKVGRSYQVGLTYQNLIINNPAAVSLACDYSEGAGLETRAGLEYQVSPGLFVRTGFNGQQINLGTGITYKNITVDYAYRLHQELGGSHRFSVSYGF
jgi:hypothetical protein